MSLQKNFISRAKKELKELQQSKPHGISVYLPSDSLQVWEAVVPGPEQSLYKGGKFKIQIYLPENYPLAAPSVRFLTSVYHVNVSQTTGHVCLAFLSDDKWLPTRTIEDVLSAVFSILIRPEVENAYDPQVLEMYNKNNEKYQQMARKSVQNAK